MYTVRAPTVSYVVLVVLIAAVRTSYVLLCRMADGNVYFSSVCCVSSSSLKLVLYNEPLDTTVALTASSAFRYFLSHYGHSRSRRRTSARRGEAPLVCIYAPNKFMKLNSNQRRQLHSFVLASGKRATQYYIYDILLYVHNVIVSTL